MFNATSSWMKLGRELINILMSKNMRLNLAAERLHIQSYSDSAISVMPRWIVGDV
jgi:hypothetical protein